MSISETDDTPRTIREFCGRNRISLTSYYELRARGLGPREMRVLSRVLITPQAERDWRLARETPSPSDIATIERLQARSRKGGRRPMRRSNPRRNEVA
jgi:hypothetical protein